MPGLVPGIHVFLAPRVSKTWMAGTSSAMTASKPKGQMLDASNHPVIDETSARYDGWRIVVVCFLVATFGWGFGFYGQSVYVAELHRLHGWPASLISGGTTFFYLFGALLVAFVSEAIRGFGPRNCLVAGVLALATAVVLIGQVTEPWQLYAADAMLAFGWAGTSLGIITNTLGLWFDNRRGMAISLALNGASFGGIVGVPLLSAAIGSLGFADAMIAAAIVMVALMIPIILIFVGRPPIGSSAIAAVSADAPSARQIRNKAFRDAPFLTVSIAFALVLFCAGRLHRPPDFVPRSRNRTGTRRDRGGAIDRDGDGRARAVLNRDRPAQPAAGFGDLVCQSGRGAIDHHQFAQRRGADRVLRAVRIFGRQSDYAAVADRAARIRPALVRCADQPDHGDQSGDLCVRSGDRRPVARCVRKLFVAVLRLHRA
jgi:hypothetical protein